MGNEVCANVWPRVTLVCQESTVQKTGLAYVVQGQSLKALVLIPPASVSALYIAVEQLEYVTKTKGDETAHVMGFTC